jgi:putative tricarboxylic transport membrane protein
MQREIDRQQLASPVQVENVPGAAGTIGLAQLVSGRRGDSGVLLVNGLVMLGAILWNQSPVSITQATPIAKLTGEYEIIAVPAASPHRNMQSLRGTTSSTTGRSTTATRFPSSAAGCSTCISRAMCSPTRG